MTEAITGSRSASDPIASGAALAISRLERHRLPVAGSDTSYAEALAREIIQSEFDLAPPRAVEIFAEQVVIADLMRRHFGEPDLTLDEAVEYLGAVRRFLNSFWHDEL